MSGYPKNVLDLKLVAKIRFQLHYANLFPCRYPSSFHLRLRRKRLVIILQGVSNPFLIAWQTCLEFIVIIICYALIPNCQKYILFGIDKNISETENTRGNCQIQRLKEF